VIVQEYIHGLSMTDLIRQKAADPDYKTIIEERYHTSIEKILFSLPYETGIQAFKYDIYYADPHPGNIIILPNNKYSIIDFGLIGISPRNKRNYYELLTQISKSIDDLDFDELGREFLKFASPQLTNYCEIIDQGSLTNESNLFQTVTKGYSSTISKIKEKFKLVESQGRQDHTQMFFDVLKLGSRFKAKAPENMLPLFRSSQLMKYISLFLEPDLYFAKEVYKEILKNVDKTKLVNYDDINIKPTQYEDALEGILDWTSQLADSDPHLYQVIEGSLDQLSSHL
jgi:hypothetical protein